MTNLDSMLKSRYVTLSTTVRLVKAMVFPMVKYGCENWTIKKAECQRNDVFEMWCWRRLESPLDCKEIQPSILKEISPTCSLVGMILKPPKIKSDTVSTVSPSISHEVMGPDAMIIVF